MCVCDAEMLRPFLCDSLLYCVVTIFSLVCYKATQLWTSALVYYSRKFRPFNLAVYLLNWNLFVFESPVFGKLSYSKLFSKPVNDRCFYMCRVML